MYHLYNIYLSSILCELKIDLRTKSGPLSYRNVLILPKLQVIVKKDTRHTARPCLETTQEVENTGSHAETILAEKASFILCFHKSYTYLALFV